MFAGCPDNAFQKVQPGMTPFTMGQRIGAPIRNGLKLFGVGVAASFIGVVSTNTLIGLRQFLDPSFTPLNQVSGAITAKYCRLLLQVLAGTLQQLGCCACFCRVLSCSDVARQGGCCLC